MTTAFRSLALATTAAHAADQITLAGLPILLTMSGASAGVISMVVAAQASAWLIISLPAGALADRLSRRRIMQVGALALIAGAILGARFAPAPVGLAAAGFLISAGVVLQFLSVFALLPRIAAGHGIARANAMLEFCRAAASLTAPLVVAAMITQGQGDWIFAIPLGCGLLALVAAAGVEHDAPAATARPSLLVSIAEGASFVRDQPILRAIALCAVAWNAAFFALTAVFAPFAMRLAGLDVVNVARAWAVLGAALLLGAALAPLVLKRLPTGFVFVLGPVSSLLGAIAIAAFGPRFGWPAIAVGMVGLGFAPMLWGVLQTSVRQLLTPPELLGRVAATITTAIYGVRPLGALAAGVIASRFGPDAAMWLAVALFALSLIAILRSPAPQLSSLPNAPAHS